MIRLYIIGLAILIIAIVANALAIKIGLKTWYDFLNLINADGFIAFKKFRAIDFLWLFLGYPLILGCGYWVGNTLYKIMSA